MSEMLYNPFTLKDKTILVTGASSGIGRTTAVECAKLGARVVVTARHKGRLNETWQMLEVQDREHIQVIADLTLEDQLNELVAQLPGLDGCVNNAGVGFTRPVQFYKSKDIENIYRINVVAPMMLTKELVKQKKLNKPSSIVFTSSIGGVFTIEPGNGIYGSSKSALDGYMRYAAKELSVKGIRCNCVNPGMVETPLIKQGTFTQDDLQNDMARYPLRRYGTPRDIALAIIYLLSDASSWITGTSLKIDGGRTLH